MTRPSSGAPFNRTTFLRRRCAALAVSQRTYSPVPKFPDVLGFSVLSAPKMGSGRPVTDGKWCCGELPSSIHYLPDDPFLFVGGRGGVRVGGGSLVQCAACAQWQEQTALSCADREDPSRARRWCHQLRSLQRCDVGQLRSRSRSRNQNLDPTRSVHALNCYECSATDRLTG